MNQSVKKWFFKGVGVGLGAVLACFLLLYGTTWYRARPKPWNTTAIKASFDDVVHSIGGWSPPTNSIGLTYVLENTTGSDYTLVWPSKLMLLYKGTFEENGNYTLKESVKIPSGQRVMCELRVPRDYATNWSIDGFAIFDTDTRFKIQFPKPTHPTPEEPKLF